MKFFSIVASLVAVAHAAIQPNTAFGLITIRSGSQLQYATLQQTSSGKLVAGASSGNDFTGFFLADGRVRVGGTDQWLTVDSDKQLAVATAAPTNFGVDDSDHLTSSDGSSGFYALPAAGNTYNIFAGTSSDPNAIGVAIRVVWNSASSSASASAAPSTTISTHASVASSAAPVTSAPAPVTSATVVQPSSQIIETVTVCHKNGTCSHSTGLPQVNAAHNAAGSIFGAAVAAIAGAILI